MRKCFWGERTWEAAYTGRSQIRANFSSKIKYVIFEPNWVEGLGWLLPHMIQFLLKMTWCWDYAIKEYFKPVYCDRDRSTFEREIIVISLHKEHISLSCVLLNTYEQKLRLISEKTDKNIADFRWTAGGCGLVTASLWHHKVTGSPDSWF